MRKILIAALLGLAGCAFGQSGYTDTNWTLPKNHAFRIVTYSKPYQVGIEIITLKHFDGSSMLVADYPYYGKQHPPIKHTTVDLRKYDKHTQLNLMWQYLRLAQITL